MRTVATGVVVSLLLAAALLWRAHAPAAAPRSESPPRIEHPDEVNVVDAPGGGKDVSVRHRLAGHLSRASLVYELDGAERTVDEASSCQKGLSGGGKIRQEEETTLVELSGNVPEGACRVNLVLVDETGTRELSVPIQ